VRGAENRLFLNQPEADVFWEAMGRIAKQETQGLDNSCTHTRANVCRKSMQAWCVGTSEVG